MSRVQGCPISRLTCAAGPVSHAGVLVACSSFPGDSFSKESISNAGDPGWISGSGRSPGGGHDNPLQCSCLENPTDGGAWRATVHGVTKSRTRLRDSHSYALSAVPGLLQEGLLADQTPAALCCGWPVGASFGVTLVPPLIAPLLGRKVPPPSSDVPVRGLAELQRLRSQGPSSRCRGAGTPRPSSPGPARLLSAPFPLEAGVGGCIGSRPSRVCVALRSPQRVNEAQFHVRPESRPCLPHFFSAIQEFTYTPVFLGASLLA